MGKNVYVFENLKQSSSYEIDELTSKLFLIRCVIPKIYNQLGHLVRAKIEGGR